MGLLDGKVALVSGVGPGLGRDIALQLAEHGADVVLGARTEATVDAVAEEVEARGRTAVRTRLDVTDADSCKGAVRAARDAFGRIDVLVNNAFQDGDFKKFEYADLDSWRGTMDVNLWGTLQLTHEVVPLMQQQRDGRIVMVNSMSMFRVEPKFGAYVASKGALASVTKTLAKELGAHGIRVNAIHPGYIWSDKQEWWIRHLAEKDGIPYELKKAQMEAETALGYFPDSAEIAGSVVFFASDLSKPVTGQALGVNAGHWFQGA